MSYKCTPKVIDHTEIVTFNGTTKEIGHMVKNILHTSRIPGQSRAQLINTLDIDHVVIERYLGTIEIFLKSGETISSRLRNFISRDFRILEKLESK